MTNESSSGSRFGTGSLRLPCSHCGVEVRRTPSTAAKSKSGRVYCTMACRDADSANRPRYKHRSDAGSRKSAWVEKPCETCGVIVARRLSDTRPRIFCGRECYFVSVRKEGRPGRPRAETPYGTTWRTNGGYEQVAVGRDHPMADKNGRCLEHRIVMSEIVGRPLLPSEDVHHINGVKHDNRPENLELWASSQPRGQRVTDLVAWAREILDTYEQVIDRL